MIGNGNNIDIYGNQFSCSQDLLNSSGVTFPDDFNQNNLPSSVASKSYTGIWTSNEGSLNLYQNQFDDLANGIVAHNASDINLSFFSIENMIPDIYPISGHGVYSISASTGGFLNVTGSGNTLYPNISNTGTAIYTERVNLNVTNTGMADVQKGVVVEMSNNVDVILQDNYIEAAQTCIGLAGNSDLNLNINSNQLIIDGIVPDEASTAIYMGAMLYGNLAEQMISGNEIRVRNSDKNAIGVKIVNAGNMNFVDNDIALDFVGTDASGWNGFEIYSGDNIHFSCNQVYGVDNEDWDSKNMHGFYIHSTTNSTYECNNLQRTKVGIRFEEGVNYDIPTDPDNSNENNMLRTNSFNKHKYGIRLNEDVIIGPQDWSGNIWSGEEQIGAYYDGTNVNDLDESRFRINGSACSSLWPCTIQDANGNPITNWFDFDDLEANLSCNFGSSCAPNQQFNDPEPPCEVAVAIMTDQVTSTKYPEGLPWLADRWLHRQILETTADGVDCGTAYDDYMINLEQHPINRLNKVSRKMKKTFRLESNSQLNFDNLKVEINNLRQTIQEYNNAISQANATDSLLLEQEKSVFANSLTNKLSLYTIVKGEWQTARKDKRNNMQMLNDGINPQFIYETNEKEINTIYLETIFINNRGINERQERTIREIAEQCPMLGGPTAVYRARAIADLLKVSYLPGDCNAISQKRTKEQSERLEVKLYPNPAGQIVQIDYRFEKEDKKSYLLHNAVGQVVRKGLIESNQGSFDLEVEDLMTGIYFFTVLDASSKVVYYEKIIIQK